MKGLAGLVFSGVLALQPISAYAQDSPDRYIYRKDSELLGSENYKLVCSVSDSVIKRGRKLGGHIFTKAYFDPIGSEEGDSLFVRVDDPDRTRTFSPGDRMSLGRKPCEADTSDMFLGADYYDANAYSRPSYQLGKDGLRIVPSGASMATIGLAISYVNGDTSIAPADKKEFLRAFKESELAPTRPVSDHYLRQLRRAFYPRRR